MTVYRNVDLSPHTITVNYKKHLIKFGIVCGFGVESQIVSILSFFQLNDKPSLIEIGSGSTVRSNQVKQLLLE